MKRKISEFSDTVSVGLVQNTVDSSIAWSNQSSCNMDEIEADRVWGEVIRGIKALSSIEQKPDIILLPELAIPRRYINKLCQFSNSSNSVIIAGLDYTVNEREKNVMNEAVVAIPKWWPEKYGYGYRKIVLGKFHFARYEEKIIRKRGYTPIQNPYFYLFDSGKFGRVGVAICADFFDIERFAVYKGQVQHLFILAYNQDISTFYFLAEAISRMVFCNVVICNTGHFGGSIAFSPYNQPFKRYIYKHEGASLFTSQTVQLPVKNLIIAQQSDDMNYALGSERFKYRPPGYNVSDDFMLYN